MNYIFPGMKLFTVIYRDKNEEGMPQRWVGYIQASSEEELRKVFLRDNPTFIVDEILEQEEKNTVV